MQVKKFTFNPFQENTYLVYDETNEGVIIDPGCYEPHEQEELLDYISTNNIQIKHLLNTHCHIDHVLGNQFVASTFGLSPQVHKDDFKTLESVDSYCHLYGFHNYLKSPDPIEMKAGDKIKFGNSELDIIFTPGHAPGHVVFYSAENKFVINGDVLFQGSFGRVDLPGGDFATLKDTILNTMFKLPEDTVVYCGHGPETTIGIEKATNPMNSL